MTPRIADDFAHIRSQLEQLQREKQMALAGEMPPVQPMPEAWTGEMYGIADWDPA